MPAARHNSRASRLRPTVVRFHHPYPIQELRRAPPFVRVVGRVAGSGDTVVVHLPHVRRSHYGGLLSNCVVDTYGHAFCVINEYPRAHLPASLLDEYFAQQ